MCDGVLLMGPQADLRGHTGKTDIGLCDYKLSDAMFSRVAVFTGVIIYDKLPRAVVVGKVLRDQKRPLYEIAWEVLAEIENQIRRRAAAIGLPDFFHNVRLDNFACICHIESGKARRFQLRTYDNPQQV